MRWPRTVLILLCCLGLAGCCSGRKQPLTRGHFRSVAQKPYATPPFTHPRTDRDVLIAKPKDSPRPAPAPVATTTPATAPTNAPIAQATPVPPTGTTKPAPETTSAAEGVASAETAASKPAAVAEAKTDSEPTSEAVATSPANTATPPPLSDPTAGTGAKEETKNIVSTPAADSPVQSAIPSETQSTPTAVAAVQQSGTVAASETPGTGNTTTKQSNAPTATPGSNRTPTASEPAPVAGANAQEDATASTDATSVSDTTKSVVTEKLETTSASPNSAASGSRTVRPDASQPAAVADSPTAESHSAPSPQNNAPVVSPGTEAVAATPIDHSSPSTVSTPPPTSTPGHSTQKSVESSLPNESVTASKSPSDDPSPADTQADSPQITAAAPRRTDDSQPESLAAKMPAAGSIDATPATIGIETDPGSVGSAGNALAVEVAPSVAAPARPGDAAKTADDIEPGYRSAQPSSSLADAAELPGVTTPSSSKGSPSSFRALAPADAASASGTSPTPASLPQTAGHADATRSSRSPAALPLSAKSPPGDETRSPESVALPAVVNSGGASPSAMTGLSAPAILHTPTEVRTGAASQTPVELPRALSAPSLSGASSSSMDVPQVHLPGSERSPAGSGAAAISLHPPATSPLTAAPAAKPISVWEGLRVASPEAPASSLPGEPSVPTPTPASPSPETPGLMASPNPRMVVGSLPNPPMPGTDPSRPVAVDPMLDAQKEAQWREAQRLREEEEKKAIEEQRKGLRRALYRFLFGTKTE